VANPIRATRRSDEPNTVYFELDAVQVKYILHLIRDVGPSGTGSAIRWADGPTSSCSPTTS